MLRVTLTNFWAADAVLNWWQLPTFFGGSPPTAIGIGEMNKPWSPCEVSRLRGRLRLVLRRIASGLDGSLIQ